ncbi:hypothetical protein [Fervidibacter sp.]
MERDRGHGTRDRKNGRARLLPSRTYRQIVKSANRQVGKRQRLATGKMAADGERWTANGE